MSGEHYKDLKVAEYFDLTEQYTKDLSFYGELARSNEHFLELGVGTGRVAVEVAKAGARVTGIDFSRAMLDIAERKLDRAGLADRVELVEGDMRDFELRHKSFDVACIPYYSFGYLYNLEDQARCLGAVRDHLKDDGLLVVHMFQPNPAYFASLAVGGIGGSVLEDGGQFQLADGRSLTVTLASSYDRSEQRVDSRVTFEEVSPDGETRKYAVPLSTHVYYRYELHLILETNGFSVSGVYGDFDRSELGPDSWEMVFVAKKSAAHAGG